MASDLPGFTLVPSGGSMAANEPAAGNAAAQDGQVAVAVVADGDRLDHHRLDLLIAEGERARIELADGAVGQAPESTVALPLIARSVTMRSVAPSIPAMRGVKSTVSGMLVPARSTNGTGPAC